jgi:hypothetical protein
MARAVSTGFWRRVFAQEDALIAKCTGLPLARPVHVYDPQPQRKSEPIQIVPGVRLMSEPDPLHPQVRSRVTRSY